jgi:hypothetical protein
VRALDSIFAPMPAYAPVDFEIASPTIAQTRASESADRSVGPTLVRTASQLEQATAL